ncbi:MAG: AMP-binding protein [Treponema sp.]|nr:AMP-binding protein [Spirochaetia bacterium]MDD7450156.1 AMP-binding protein [Treponema sp.]MDY2924056.1 AMP-binding protein [Treponema sp.]MDY5683722.1 AMP-binding protein [Treponema sp.]
MNFYKDYVENGKEYSDYEDFKENFKIKVPENFNFAYDIVDRYAELEPAKRAMVWCDDNGEEHFFTFKDFAEKSNQTANFLIKHGIKKGDTVLLILRRRYEFWYFILALHKIGAIAVPATNQLLSKDIEFRANAASIKMVVSYQDSLVQQRIEEAMPASPSVKELVTVGSHRDGWVDFYSEMENISTDFVRPAGDAATQNSDTMLLYFTSGTSGNPKMVQHNFAYPLGHIVTAKYWQNVIDGGLHFTVAETGWAKAVWGKLYGQWICGSAVMVYDMNSFSPSKTIDVISRYKVTTFCAPPTTYRFLVKVDAKKYDLSALKYVVTAGEALTPELFESVYKYTGLKMFEAFGQTEATVMIGNFPGMTPKPGSMGKPAPGYDIEIVRPDGTKCEPNEEGSIIIHLDRNRPVGLFSGYYKNEELTAKAFENGVYNTGDVAKYDEEGYFWFIGRNDDIIKTAGYRVSPFEIESTLLLHPAVLECAVTGIPDEKRGQAIKATIVLNKGFEPGKELKLDIFDFIKNKIATYKHPRIIEFVDQLPKTISGKIRRVEIRSQDSK